MLEQQIRILQNMPIFAGITDESLEFLLDGAPIIKLAAGEYFFRENEMGGEMFVLEAGRVEVCKGWNGKEYHLNNLGPGDCFGEMSLIDMCHRSASVLAIEPCVAIRLGNAAISSLFRRDLEQFALIQMNMGREVSRRLRIADESLFQELAEANKIPLLGRDGDSDH